MTLPLFALLAERVRRKPQAVAVIYRAQKVSYLALAAGTIK